MPDKISAVIIAQNEEENLADCLRSLDFADEVVVCDGGSEDGTVEIATAMGAIVVHRPFDGFSAQKNYAVSQAAGPWILSLDADERVSPELRREISAIMEHKDTGITGYRMPRKSFFGRKWVRHGGWWPDYNLRLFRQGHGRFVDRAVHECVQVDGPVGTLKGALEHYSYRDVSDFLRRMDRYSTLAAEQSLLEGRRAGVADLLLRPAAAFVRMYIVRAGFLDGVLGFKLAVLYAFYTFAKYAKLMEKSEADA